MHMVDRVRCLPSVESVRRYEGHARNMNPSMSGLLRQHAHAQLIHQLHVAIVIVRANEAVNSIVVVSFKTFWFQGLCITVLHHAEEATRTPGRGIALRRTSSLVTQAYGTFATPNSCPPVFYSHHPSLTESTPISTPSLSAHSAHSTSIVSSKPCVSVPPKQSNFS
jgi:hypothetical protein